VKKALATLLTISVLFITGGINYPSLQADETEFSLIDYLETHEINSYEDFLDVIETVSPESVDAEDEDPNEIAFFSIDIDYDNMMVSVLTMDDVLHDRSHVASSSATKSYYSDNGYKIFTIKIVGTFNYSTGSCNTTSASGSYTRAPLSSWTSTPTISAGHITPSKAYARISGNAVNGSNSTSYSLTLTCNDSGTFSSY